MLRIMMLDLKNMDEARFTAMMREYYTTYQGKRASTEDFRRVGRFNDLDGFWLRSRQ